MKNRKLAALVALVIVLVIYLINTSLQPAPTTESKIVTRIVDGDTIVVEGGSIIRLLDIDTPEKGQPCYTEAKNRLSELIWNREVILERGKDDKDVYDRYLRYIIYNDTLINLQLVREGFAHLYVYNKDTPYYSYLVEAEQAAKAENLCVWNVTK